MCGFAGRRAGETPTPGGQVMGAPGPTGGKSGGPDTEDGSVMLPQAKSAANAGDRVSLSLKIRLPSFKSSKGQEHARG